MNREFLEQLGLDGEKIERILAEFDRLRDELSTKLAKALDRCAALENELAEIKSDGGFDMAKKAFDLALEAIRAEHEKMLLTEKKAAERRLEEALSAKSAELEKEKLRMKVEDLFAKAGFNSALAMRAAVERFISEGGTPDNAGSWLTKLRETEPDAFAKVAPAQNLPRFTVESPAAEDGSAPGGLLSSMLKKLR